MTENIRQFANGKTISGLVNGIRAIAYINHGENDGNNWIIQYADETLTKGKGDCTDKVLLLYACMLANGYDSDDMAVAVVTDCTGEYSHNVLLTNVAQVYILYMHNISLTLELSRGKEKLPNSIFVNSGVCT